MISHDATARFSHKASATVHDNAIQPVSKQLRLHGKTRQLSSVTLDGRLVIATGRFLRIASIYDEDLIEGDSMANPEDFITQLERSGFKADLFTFAQRLPDTAPRYSFVHESDTLAVIPVTTFPKWQDSHSGIRKALRKAERVGVQIKLVIPNDAFLQGVSHLYNESPIRQGKLFWHYQEDLQSIREALSTYSERSTFIGAYYESELIGFLQFVTVGPTASILQILSAHSHFDKRPNNALIARAVEFCEQRGLTHLIYGAYGSYDPNSSLTEFKRRNGFQPVSLPRYYVPLTLKGYIALLFGAHRGVVSQIPAPIRGALLRLRSSWYEKRYHPARAA